MKKGTRKWLLGAGIAAGGAASAAAATRAASRYMVRLAMDREGPKKAENGIKRVSGSWENTALTAATARAKRALEEQTGQMVEIQSCDGLRLVGHWHPARQPKRILIAMHGWRSSWSRDFGIIAPFWQESGCSVLYAEQRGQGESGGAYMGFGMLERHDCLKWVQWAHEHNPHNLPIYLVGLSMGATTVLMTGGMELPASVHGIMADCGFTSAHAIWKHVAEANLHLHYSLYAAAADDLCKKKINMGSREYTTVDALRQCKVPVLLVHGTDDSFVPVTMTYENYKACAGPKHLLIVPGAEHGCSYCTEQTRYEKAVLEFWQAYDGAQPPTPEEPEATV